MERRVGESTNEMTNTDEMPWSMQKGKPRTAKRLELNPHAALTEQ